MYVFARIMKQALTHLTFDEPTYSNILARSGNIKLLRTALAFKQCSNLARRAAAIISIKRLWSFFELLKRGVLSISMRYREYLCNL